jgi:poly(A) polymerase
MTSTLPDQAWRRAPGLAAVLDALEAAGGEGCVRMVGGCVRNALLRQPVADIDLATPLTPPEVITAAEAAGLKCVPTGLDHGTVTVIADHKGYEVTTLRRDVETDGRRAVVAFTSDWAEDAARRDFTLNALYADRAGRIFDPTGRGLADLEARRLVFVGDARTRIREDALRILRFFRFHAWYGAGAPDAEALGACAELKDLAANLSAERVAAEWLKLLGAPDPRASVRLAADAGVLAVILPEASRLDRFAALVEIETDILFTDDALLRFAALLPDQAGAEAVARRLKLSNAQRERLTAALAADPALKSWMSPREVRRAVYRLGAQPFQDQAMLAWAEAGGAGAAQWRSLIPMAQGWTPPRLPLSGEEVKAAGVPDGPLVGRVMREVEAWWIDADFPMDKLGIIERLKAVAQGMAA